MNQLTGISEIQKDVEKILVYSQDYPFYLDASILMQQWKQAKAPFIEKFGGTIWKSEKIIQAPLSEKDKKDKFNEFLSYIQRTLSMEEFDDFLRQNYEGFFSNRVIKDYPSKRIRQGAKLVKSFKHFVHDEDMIRWAQDLASEYIQEDKIEGYLYLSVDPRDFLTLSENNANWGSCHSLDGDFRAGNLSYMVDNTTFIAYIANEKQERLRCMPQGMVWNSKKWRMLVHINESSTIYYNKQYPFHSGELLNTADAVITSLFSPKQEFVNPIRYGFRTINLGEYETGLSNNYLISPASDVYDTKEVINDTDHLGFVDLISSSSYAPIINLPLDNERQCIEADDRKKVFHDTFDIKIGGQVVCPCCGERFIERDDSFLCEMCIAEKDADEDFYCICAGCGGRIYEDEEIIEIKGDYYCERCHNGMIED